MGTPSTQLTEGLDPKNLGMDPSDNEDQNSVGSIF